MTSHDAVQRVRRAYGTRAVGHTGTLDPFATGLLVVLLGRATRLARFVEGQPKTYLATARLGAVTDTDDLTGAVIETRPMVRPVGEAEVREALNGFHGVQLQRPPVYSAKHVGGERSYRLARRGRAVEPAPAEVEVFAIELVAIAGTDAEFRLTVSPGTYIRAIARDLGQRLGIGAHLTALRRESIGTLDVRQAVALAELSAEVPLLAPVQVLSHLPMRCIDRGEAAAIRHGRAVGGDGALSGLVGLIADGKLLAVADADGVMLQPRVVLEGG